MESIRTMACVAATLSSSISQGTTNSDTRCISSHCSSCLRLSYPSLRSQKSKIISSALQGGIGSGNFERRQCKPLKSIKQIISLRNVVRGSSLQEEPLDSKVEKTITEASKELRKEGSEARQSWNRSVDDLKAETNKVQGHSGETANKELEKLKDITNQLLEQAEYARASLTASAQETASRGKENLSYVAENGPDPIKEVAETALNAHYSEVPKKGSKIHDFCLGIPYGIFLVAGGLLWFIIAGGTSPIRFGVLLGGLLLALSVTSLKVWKRGESSLLYIQGQAAITCILFIRSFRAYSQTKLIFPTLITGLVSAAMLAFYVYVFLSGGNPPKKQKAEPVA